MSFKLIVALFAVAAVGIEGRPYEEEVFDCNGKPSGYYADVSDPKAFYSCMEGSLIAKVVCEDGFEFDGIETCVPVAAAEESSPDAGGQTDGDELAENLPTYPPGEDDDDDAAPAGMSKKKIYNIEITKNIFPRSILIIGKMNREQKNK